VVTGYRNKIGGNKKEKKKGEMGGRCSTHGEMRNALTILIGKPKRKGSFRPRNSCEDSMDQTHTAQDRSATGSRGSGNLRTYLFVVY
jgi:hypothetical protein